MRTDVFDFDLPPNLIAQDPRSQRDLARLLVVERETASLSHHVFHDLPALLTKGDLLILNDTRVVPARLVGKRAKTGGRWEGLFLGSQPNGCWELLCRTRGRLADEEVIRVEPGPLELKLLARTPQGYWVARPSEAGPAHELLERFGRVPLPRYIRKGRAGEADRDRYQTVYARRPGAVAAPTAGLHFTAPLFDNLERRGIGWSFVTLHVGPGTFQPLQKDRVEDHTLHREWAEISAATAQAVATCRESGRRVVAVGTTSVRVLETVAASGSVRPWSGDTDLFIYSPYEFQVVDALVTNFHLPRTSLLVLVSAFGGMELIRKAYQTAIEQHYRFYSYGDAMLIL